jgi:hypothetical protein
MQTLVSFNPALTMQGDSCVLKWTQAADDRSRSNLPVLDDENGGRRWPWLVHHVAPPYPMLFDVLEGGSICNFLLPVDKERGGAKWQMITL